MIEAIVFNEDNDKLSRRMIQNFCLEYLPWWYRQHRDSIEFGMILLGLIDVTVEYCDWNYWCGYLLFESALCEIRFFFFLKHMLCKKHLGLFFGEKRTGMIVINIEIKCWLKRCLSWKMGDHRIHSLSKVNLCRKVSWRVFLKVVLHDYSAGGLK